jgi:hypothetical protein
VESREKRKEQKKVAKTRAARWVEWESGSGEWFVKNPFLQPTVFFVPKPPEKWKTALKIRK